jgi:TolB-like protein/AraC-like DNA-binding protein/Tfp pilus assembly protein PilF
MLDPRFTSSDFITQLTAIVEKNIASEQFGVSELADAMNMSRSNLLRKVKKETKLSVSQLISQIRLKKGIELLRQSSLNVSEVAHQVGFSSTSYFIKCFREFYGYPPGEVGKRDVERDTFAEKTVEPAHDVTIAPRSNRRSVIIVSAVLLIVAAIGFLFFTFPSSGPINSEKSIAVLPFKNDSNDSSNVYLINGLMESTLTNLQTIKDLKVTSRTTSEKYRNTTKSIPEMAKELSVNYFVEGSGQKMGDQILLNIQLIEAATDKHLWAKQYRTEVKDIFELQEEIAKNIAKEIQVFITPQEEKQIGKKPTENVIAYDNFLKGKDLFYKSTHESLMASIPYFKKAIELDHKFALAYANAAMVYYYLDIFQKEKKYGVEISSCADNAISSDPKLSDSHIAKALSYAHREEYNQAVQHLEKALEYDPNSGLVVHFLMEFYNMHVPNTAKYLEYALMGVKLDITLNDSATTSFKYLHLSNALMQTGFVDEANRFIDKSLEYHPENTIARYVKVWFRFAKHKNTEQAKNLLLEELKRDSTRLDVLQEVGKACYYTRDYENAYKYYKQFLQLRERQQMDIFKHQDLNIAFVFSKMGDNEKAAKLAEGYKTYAENDKSIYKHMNLALCYAYAGRDREAIEELKLFSKEDNYQFWILFYDVDPMIDRLKKNPAFKSVMRDVEAKFWETHKDIRKTLEAKELL